MSLFALGVDIGGTHITAAVVDLAHRKIIHETITRKPIDAGASVSNIISFWAGAMREAIRRFEGNITQVGIAMPGPFDYDHGISLMQNQGKYDALYEVNVKELLAHELGLTTQNIKLQNDAACFLQGEAFAGASQGYQRAIGLTLGTGLGSAIYSNGEALDADLWDKPFKESTAEAYLSTRWFVQSLFELTGRRADNVKSIVELLPNELRVKELFVEFADNLATFLTPFVQREQSDVIVLGGNISKTFNLFGDTLLDRLREQNIHVPLKLAALGEKAALLGASSLWWEYHHV